MNTIWIAKADEKNKPTWEIINAETRKTIVFGLSKADAELHCKQRNKKQKK
jgi:hypothetical protein